MGTYSVHYFVFGFDIKKIQILLSSKKVYTADF